MDIDNNTEYFEFGHMILCQPKEFKTPYGPLLTDNIIDIMCFLIKQRYKKLKREAEQKGWPEWRWEPALRRYSDFSSCFDECIKTVHSEEGFFPDSPLLLITFQKIINNLIVHSYRILYLVFDFKMSKYLEAFLAKLDEYYKFLADKVHNETLAEIFNS